MLKNNTIKAFLIFGLFFLLSCESQVNKSNNQIEEVNIIDSYGQNVEVNLSEIIDNKIEYVQLETTKNNLLGSSIKICSNDSQIITFSYRQIFLFNRKTGEFLREIGHYGKDPGGYKYVAFCFPYDEIKNCCIAGGWKSNSFIEYDLSGAIKNEITGPKNTEQLANLKDNYFVSYIRNFDGNEKNKLTVFNVNDSYTKNYSNYLGFKPTGQAVKWGNHGWFYKYNNNIGFFELFTDTVFYVSKEQLMPRFTFKLGDKAPPYSEQQSIEFMRNKAKDYLFMENIFESTKYLLFNVKYEKNVFQGFYDKNNHETKITGNPEGFKNDVDSLFPFQYSSVNTSGELVGFKEAYKVLKWYNDNSPEVALNSPFIKKLKNIKESDNPIVMIAKLKK